MLVLFDVSFVRFYFILVNDGVEKPRPSPFTAKIIIFNKGKRFNSCQAVQSIRGAFSVQFCPQLSVMSLNHPHHHHFTFPAVFSVM
ncbi:hypothetical protein INR49_018520 [Caranx melampygus]|nr:hypothetical protein INR49_018520 [Caranx melampygus]